MNKDDLQSKLTSIEISLAEINVHLQNIKADTSYSALKSDAMQIRVDNIEKFQSKATGAAMIIAPILAFLATFGYDFIKKLLGIG